MNLKKLMICPECKKKMEYFDIQWYTEEKLEVGVMYPIEIRILPEITYICPKCGIITTKKLKDIIYKPNNE